LSLREKARLLARAEVIAGPHGAGLTNILFAPPGCKVFEVFDPNHMMVNYYAAADALRQRYYYLIGENAGRADARHGATGHDDIHVPADLFARSLARVLGE
jgi:capsular polysaccharide biosynthesis protein